MASQPQPPSTGSTAPPHSGPLTKILFSLGGIVGLAAPIVYGFVSSTAGGALAAVGMGLLGAGAIVHANFDAA